MDLIDVIGGMLELVKALVIRSVGLKSSPWIRSISKPSERSEWLRGFTKTSREINLAN